MSICTPFSFSDCSSFELQAICVLNEVIRLAPNLSDPYHTLALIYTAMGDEKRALNFYMIAAHLTPKNASLWKVLVTRSM